MDQRNQRIKFVIVLLLLALLFIVIVVYRELTTLKDEFINNMTNVSLLFQQKSDKMLSNLQNNMIKCVSQVKSISSDNLHQLRKITVLNNQPINRISNHFTETDDSEIHTDINYLSDNKPRIFKHQISQSVQSPYYMSEDTSSDRSSNCISSRKLSDTSNNDNNVCVGDVCYRTSENNSDSLPIYHSDARNINPPNTRNNYDTVNYKSCLNPVPATSNNLDNNLNNDNNDNGPNNLFTLPTYHSNNRIDNILINNQYGGDANLNDGSIKIPLHNNFNGQIDTSLVHTLYGHTGSNNIKEQKKIDSLNHDEILVHLSDHDSYSNDTCSQSDKFIKDTDIFSDNPIISQITPIHVRNNPTDSHELEVDLHNVLSGNITIPQEVVQFMVPEFNDMYVDIPDDNRIVDVGSNSDSASHHSHPSCEHIDMSNSLKDFLDNVAKDSLGNSVSTDSSYSSSVDYESDSYSNLDIDTQISGDDTSVTESYEYDSPNSANASTSSSESPIISKVSYKAKPKLSLKVTTDTNFNTQANQTIDQSSSDSESINNTFKNNDQSIHDLNLESQLESQYGARTDKCSNNISHESEESHESEISRKSEVSREDSKASSEDFETPQLSELKPLKEYSLGELKDIAKSLSIALSYKSTKGRRTYKKNELYKSIKKRLIKNI